MSLPPSPRPTANPTRQQLDDLDELLQRMLDLPVNRLDEEPGDDRPATLDPPAAERWDPPPAPPPVFVPRPPTVSAGPGTSPPVAGPTAPISPPPVPEAPPESRPTAAETPGPAPEDESVLAAALFRWRQTLLAVNRGYDHVASRLGAPGRWAQGPRGRAVLGWAGLALLVLSGLVLLRDWIGWPR